jgi:phage gp46-like protein
MADVIIRSNEGCDPDPFLLWDSVWRQRLGFADWAYADPDETLNRGGLRAKAALATAVVLCLFTDKRVDPTHPLYWLADGDPRGWFGDGVDVRADLGEAPLGSLLWLLERAPLTIAGQPASQWAEQFASDALAPLKNQSAAARIDVAANVDEINSRLNLIVDLYGRDGQNVYSGKFEILWNQVAR